MLSPLQAFGLGIVGGILLGLCISIFTLRMYFTETMKYVFRDLIEKGDKVKHG